jgi:hypothetical protein
MHCLTAFGEHCAFNQIVFLIYLDALFACKKAKQSSADFFA